MDKNITISASDFFKAGFAMAMGAITAMNVVKIVENATKKVSKKIEAMAKDDVNEEG